MICHPNSQWTGDGRREKPQYLDEPILRVEWIRSLEAHLCVMTVECMEVLLAHGRVSHCHVCPEMLSHLEPPNIHTQVCKRH